MITHVQIEILLYGHTWTVEAEILIDGDVSSVRIEQAHGERNGRAEWLDASGIERRLGRFDFEALNEKLIRAAREQLNAAAIRQRMQGG